MPLLVTCAVVDWIIVSYLNSRNSFSHDYWSVSQYCLFVVIFTDAFTDSAVSAKVNGEHKERDLEPWDAGELTTSEELEALENDVVSAIRDGPACLVDPNYQQVCVLGST